MDRMHSMQARSYVARLSGWTSKMTVLTGHSVGSVSRVVRGLMQSEQGSSSPMFEKCLVSSKVSYPILIAVYY